MNCSVCVDRRWLHYVYHKAGADKRRHDSYVCHYVCTEYKRLGRKCDHVNRVLAGEAEEWMLDHIRDLVSFDGIADRVIQRAAANCQKDQQPLRDSLNRTNNALCKNQEQIDTLIQTITSGAANSDMMAILNERATELRGQREVLRQEVHRLNKSLIPTSDSFDVDRFQKALYNFEGVLSEAAPERIQKLLRLIVKNIKWSRDGMRDIDLYIPLQSKEKPLHTGHAERFDFNVQSGGLARFSVEPVFLRLFYYGNNALSLASPLIQRV